MKLLAIVFAVILISVGCSSQQQSPAEVVDMILAALTGALNIAKNFPQAIDSMERTVAIQKVDVYINMTSIVLNSLNQTASAIASLAASEDIAQNAKKIEALTDLQAAATALAIPVVQLQNTLQEVDANGLSQTMSVRLDLLSTTLKQNVDKVTKEVSKTDRVKF